MSRTLVVRALACAALAGSIAAPRASFAQALLSQGKPAVASSVEGSFAAANAVDGNAGTRWGSAFSDPQWIRIDLGATATITRVVLSWEAAYGRAYQIQVSADATSWTTIYSTTNGDGGTDDVTVTGSGRYVRMNGTARATSWGYSLFELQVYGTTGTASNLLSQAKPSSASCNEAGYTPAAAFDGNTGTRWSSCFSDPQWIQVDLGATATVNRVVLRWEAAYGRGYQIQVSANGTAWTNVFSTTTGDGGVDDLTVSGSGRYVRMNGTARATGYGYSLWEFQVYGTGGGTTTCTTLPGTPAAPSASGVTTSSVTLSWSAPTAGANCTITGYRVYQNGSLAASPTGTSAAIGGLTANTQYRFAVSAVNQAGEGARSPETTVTTSGSTTYPTDPANPNWGPNVRVFDTSMSTSSIQSAINSIYATQQNNQFGPARNAILFKPGTYPVDVPVGFYTHVMGLGARPDDVNITAQVHSDPVLANNNATQNFWRAVENFSVTPPGAGMEWAVSQAVPFRRMHVRGNNLYLHRFGGWASGGWISDSVVDYDVNSGSQQQWISRNAQWGSWTGNVWNMVFVGIPNNLPGGTWPTTRNTIVNPTPVVAEKPFLWLNGANYEVYVPALRTNLNGITWGAGQTQGTSRSLREFYLARPGDSAATINAQLAAGWNVLFTPGIYDLNQPIQVNRAGTVVMGMGFATLRPTAGNAALTVADVDGVRISHVFVDAGATNSPVLVQVGPPGSNAGHAANPTVLHDVFVRVGGAGVGNATVSMEINSNHVIIDHTWLWRADHGSGWGWTVNRARNGLVVNGQNVTAYGLFVEHYQEYQVVWNGNGGRTYFYQSEIPYDVPDQNSWRSAAGVNGWASYKVASGVTSHEAWGMGIYAVFTYPTVYLSRAIEAPVNANVRFHQLCTQNLTANGGIQRVINDTGPATPPGIAVQPWPEVAEYP